MKTRDNLELFYSEIISLYVEEKRSPSEICGLLKPRIETITHQRIVRVLQKAGKLRSRKEAAKHIRYRGKTCKTCQCEFAGTSSRQIYCLVCAPDKSAYNRLQKFGLTQKDFDDMKKAQNNACAICRFNFHELQSLNVHVDHDHKTGKVRGILCGGCNMRVGVIEDKEWIKNGTAYLKRFE